MPKRKQDLYDTRRQQIIDGALQVFSTKGFIAATNKDVAEAAGINSAGLIYHYFADKEALLRAMIEHYSPSMELVTQTDALMALPPEQGLAQIGQAFLRAMNDPKIKACRRVLFGEAMRSPQFAEILREVGPARVIWTFLAEYLQRKMDEGLLRRADPMIAARCFVGPLIAHIFMQTVLILPDELDLDTAALVTTQVQIFLHGLKSKL